MTWTIVWVGFVTAIASYFLGCINGAIIVSDQFYHEDIRKKGSGNAGLTNFYRVYGKRHILLVLAIDILKAALGVYIGAFLFRWQFDQWTLGKYWAALWVVLGHNYPCVHAFRGGKGILCAGTLLLLLDWRIALVGFATFILLTALTGFVSLGSVTGAATFPVTTFFVFREQDPKYLMFAISLLTAAIVIWAHRGNIQRLSEGRERKFQFHHLEKKTESNENETQTE